jgi:hypothetical protein
VMDGDGRGDDLLEGRGKTTAPPGVMATVQ